MGESFGVFLLPLSNYFSWDRASVTSIYSIYMFFLGLGSLLSEFYLIDMGQGLIIFLEHHF